MTSCNCTAVCDERYEQLEQLIPLVTTKIPQLPYEYVMLGLRQAFIQFARKTGLVTVTYPITYQKDVNDYELIPPEGYQIYQLIRVKANNCCSYKPASPDYWYCCGYGFRYAHNRIIFAQTPSRDQDEAVQVTVIVIPTNCVDTIPESISTPFGDGIAAKVLEEAHSMVGKPWYNPIESRKAAQKFARDVQQGKALAWSNRTPETMHLRRQRWV